MSPPNIVSPNVAGLPDAPPPAPLPPAAATATPTLTDEEAQQARADGVKRARAFQGYASTIKSGSQGVIGPAFTTANSGKATFG